MLLKAVVLTALKNVALLSTEYIQLRIQASSYQSSHVSQTRPGATVYRGEAVSKDVVVMDTLFGHHEGLSVQ